jgi:hypothetical protein
MAGFRQDAVHAKPRNGVQDALIVGGHHDVTRKLEGEGVTRHDADQGLAPEEAKRFARQSGGIVPGGDYADEAHSRS